jgi:hypothetical protein
LENVGARLANFAPIASLRSSDVNLAEFIIATNSSPSPTL